jgi:hypothetical protein
VSDPTYLSKAEAAALTGKSEATIQRYRRDGKLPSSRYRPDGTLEVAVADLVSAGLLDPLAAAGGVEEIAGRTRSERDLLAARRDLAVAEARLDALAGRLDEAHDQIAFLRALLKDAA